MRLDSEAGTAKVMRTASLAPSTQDDYCGITAFLCLWLSVFAFVDNVGEPRHEVHAFRMAEESRTWIQRWEEFETWHFPSIYSYCNCFVRS